MLLNKKELPLLLTLIGSTFSIGSSLQKSSIIPYDVPSFTFDDIKSGHFDKDVKSILTSTGLLAIRLPLSSSDRNPSRIVEGLCACAHNIDATIPGGDRILLNDAVTTRSTIATATHGLSQPLALPEKEVSLACGSSVVKGMEETRDTVSRVTSEAFLPALDRLVKRSVMTQTQSGRLTSAMSILTKTNGEEYESITTVVEDAVHLEHFHVYSKEEHDNKEEDKRRGDAVPVDDALDWHTDAGLFLAFIPGVSCGEVTALVEEDSSFRVLIPKEIGGTTIMEERVAVFPQTNEGEAVVAIMLGTGAQHWLDMPDDLNLKATKHAVKMRDGESRVWYGMSKFLLILYSCSLLIS